MVKEENKRSDADSSLSEIFLEFAEPLFETAGSLSGGTSMNTFVGALKLAAMVWNGVVLDAVHGNSLYADEIRKSVAGNKESAELVERMILRKQTRYADGLQLIGNYRLEQEAGEWRLRIEVRKPERQGRFEV
jgi:hypothetical protein